MSRASQPAHGSPAPEGRGSPHNRGQLLLVFLLTALPVLVAVVVFFTPSLRDNFQHNNRGNLVTPVKTVPAVTLLDLDGRPLPQNAFSGHWSLIYIGGSACDNTCVRQVFKVHNIRWLLQEQYKRLRVFYLAPDTVMLHSAARTLMNKPVLLKKAGGLPVMVANVVGHDGVSAMRFFNQPAGSVVLVNPLRQWTLAYPSPFTVEDVYHDLRRLLRYSQLG